MKRTTTTEQIMTAVVSHGRISLGSDRCDAARPLDWRLSLMTTPPLPALTCVHCGSTWTPRKPDPVQCPRCHRLRRDYTKKEKAS